MWSEWWFSSPVLQQFALAVFGLSAGLSVASGVFTVFTAVGLVPRFAEHTKSGNRIMLYENMIILGCFSGCVYSLFYKQLDKLFAPMRIPSLPGAWLEAALRGDWLSAIASGGGLAAAILGIAGVFVGIYVGTLAISIAEMLDAIPIMTHRINVKRGVSLVIAGLAVGKLVGSFFYFMKGVYAW